LQSNISLDFCSTIRGANTLDSISEMIIVMTRFERGKQEINYTTQHKESHSP
jgi:hypothetical protein